MAVILSNIFKFSARQLKLIPFKLLGYILLMSTLMGKPSGKPNKEKKG